MLTNSAPASRRPPSARTFPSDEVVREIYKKGEVNEQGARYYPTMRQLADRWGVSAQRISTVVGGVKATEKRKTVGIHFRATPTAVARLKDIALEFGYRNPSGPKPNEGSINMLMDKIGTGELIVERPTPADESS